MIADDLFSRQRAGSGVKLVADKTGFIITPCGEVDLSHLDLAPPTPTNLEMSPRGNAFLLTLKKGGKMFISPAGEVDLSLLETRNTRTLSLSQCELIKLNSEGDLSPSASQSGLVTDVPSLERTKSVLLTRQGAKKIGDDKQDESGELSHADSEVVIAPLSNGKIVCSAGEIGPDTSSEDVDGQLYKVSLLHNGDVTIQELLVPSKKSKGKPTPDVQQWLQLF